VTIRSLTKYMREKRPYLLLNGKELMDLQESLADYLHSFDILTVTRLLPEGDDRYILDSKIFQPPSLDPKKICPSTEYLFFDLSLLGDPFVRKMFNDRTTDNYYFSLNKKDADYTKSMNEMIRTYQKSKDHLFGERLVSSILNNNVLHLKSTYENASSSVQYFVNGNAPRNYQQIADGFRGLIVQHVKKQKKVNYYSDLLHITDRTLSTVIRSIFDKTPKEIIDEYIIELSKKLLEDKELSIKQIAYELGYRSPNNFSMFFRKHQKITPTDYRLKFCE